MKRILSFVRVVVLVLMLNGCEQPDSSIQENISSDGVSRQSALEQIEQFCGENYLIYNADGYTLYTGNGQAFMMDESYVLTEYLFSTNYKNGDYRIEIYDENDWQSGNHIILRLEHGEITDVLKFKKSDMFRSLGSGNKLEASCDEKLMTGKLYCQRSGITIDFNFAEGNVSAEGDIPLDIGQYFNPMAVRRDGRYIVYAKSDGYEDDIYLADSATGELVLLEQRLLHPSAGFLPDGNIYIMSKENYRIFSPDGKAVYALSDHIPVGVIDEQNEISRKICGFYHDINHGRCYAVYFDRGSSGKTDYVPGTTLLYDTYKVAVLDENGNLLKTVETDKYAETKNSFYCDVDIRDVNEYTVSFYRETYNSLEFEVFVDLATDEVSLRDYRSWE